MTDKKNGSLAGVRFSRSRVTGDQGAASKVSSFAYGLTRQIKRSRRAQAVHDRQRALLLQVIVETMVEFDLSDADIRSAYRACAASVPCDGPDAAHEKGAAP